jgi:saccharopine dehydrogenase (NADP+, L-glutamate forming)/spermidine synthase
LVESSPQGEALGLDIEDTPRVLREILRVDLAISLLPFPFHPRVAELCIQTRTDLITASYTSDRMQNLEPEIKRAGILILNEIGLDPGIDHMEAMRVIHAVKERGGGVRSFISFCGGLPAPEANTNPLGYKFSWSPSGVLAASRSPACYLRDGKKVDVAPQDLFAEPWVFSFPHIGRLEGYPNRDSLPYLELYDISDTRTMLRGTLRYPGWCVFMQAAGRLGLLKDEDAPPGSQETRQEYLKRQMGVPSQMNISEAFKLRLGSQLFQEVQEAFDWLGFWEDASIPDDADSPLKVLAACLQEKLQFQPGERDMVVLSHRVESLFPDGKGERTHSTLIEYGDPAGDSAMARTVGLPLAAAARLVLEGRIRLKGLHIPVRPEIYLPILEALKAFSMDFKVEIEPIPPDPT